MAAYAGAAVRLQKQGRLGEVELVDLLSRIETQANEAGTILDKLRALIRRGDQPVVPVDVNQVAESCLDFLREDIQQRGVRIERRFGHDLPKPIGDPIELGHVLIQLISNALEAMQDAAMDKRRLSISTGHDSQADLIVIEVSDTGPGVRPELVGLLFDPWRMDQPEGLGIGLSVARTIVESHGGEICMKNEESGGATFRVALPLVREEAA
jgi:C4-dicarboxylate-specific signal transduction histidine kinase